MGKEPTPSPNGYLGEVFEFKYKILMELTLYNEDQ
jgi:hypothetical protein